MSRKAQRARKLLPRVYDLAPIRWGGGTNKGAGGVQRDGSAKARDRSRSAEWRDDAELTYRLCANGEKEDVGRAQVLRARRLQCVVKGEQKEAAQAWTRGGERAKFPTTRQKSVTRPTPPPSHSGDSKTTNANWSANVNELEQNFEKKECIDCETTSAVDDYIYV